MALGALLGLQLAHLSPPSTPRPVLPPQQRPAQLVEPSQPTDSASPAAGVLILYSFFDGDEVSWGNLLFFLQHAVRGGDGGRYIVILNGFNSLDDGRLPSLPPNAEYALHRNECYDWGTYEWALRSLVQSESYQCARFSWLESRMRSERVVCAADLRARMSAAVSLCEAKRKQCSCRLYIYQQLRAWPHTSVVR